jgi:hypothetical protein
MAVNEENERRVLEATALLNRMKEAEEIAGIADQLGLPESVEEEFER